MPVPSKRAGALALLIALVAAACGSTTAASTPFESAPALEGEYATLDGASIDLAELRGQDVVLWFWAPW